MILEEDTKSNIKTQMKNKEKINNQTEAVKDFNKIVNFIDFKGNDMA